MLGPENATREQIELAIATRLDTGRDAEGFRTKITEWRGRDIETDAQNSFWRAFENFGDKADFEISEDNPEEPGDWESESEDEE